MRFDGATVEKAELERTRDMMFHRGPDAAGTYVDGPVGLALRRLAIIDLTHAGDQPMPNEDRTIWIVFNGEIYNYVELRDDLRARGHVFRSSGDTEVIVHLYEEFGERCVDHLRGMFSFLIWDSRRQRCFGARDRLGIKPFFYFADKSQFVCASDIKAILSSPGVPRTVDRTSIADYLFSGFPLADRSMFAGIRQLAPGHTITVERGTVRTQQYWDVEYRYDSSRSDADLASQLASLLDDSVRVHCRSDAPVGCHLSGGLDSSVVTGLATRHREGLSTYSIRFGHGGWYDETAYAKVMADFARAEYHEAAPNGRDFAHLLPGLVWHMEMPLPNIGGFSYYTVSKLASKHVKVSLTGHGGDEIFGGYPAQFETAFGVLPFEGAPDQRLSYPAEPQRGFARMRRFGRRLAKLGVRGVAERIGDRLRVRKPSSEEMWLALHASQVPQRHPLLSGEFVRSLHGYSPRDAYLAPFRSAPTSELFDRCLYHDLRCYLPALLYMEDRVSMAVSVESRVPLIDHRIVDFMASVPPLQKVPAMQPKGLLRSAARGTIPEMIRRRPDKRPFPVPFQIWVRDVLGELSRDVLLSPQSLDRGILDPDRLRAWDLTNDEIWCGLNLEMWFRIFIDQDAALIDQANALRSFKALGAYPSPS